MRAHPSALLLLGLVACADLEPQPGKLRVACVDADSNPGASVSFLSDIRPLMDRSNTDPSGHGCKACHYSTQPSHAGLDATGLDLYELGKLRLGGHTTGASIVIPGKPCESGLVQKLQGDYPVGVRMPKDGPPYWSTAEIQLVIDWIAEGANGGSDQ